MSEMIRLRCGPAWRSWLRQFSEHLGLAESDLIDAALAHFAVARRFQPPPRR
jgi:hypothetical protein